MTAMPLMIFAAGFGTRMGALTRHMPKPLIPVAGRPLIDHALDVARGAGAGPVVVNLHYRADMLAAHLADRNVALSREVGEILETGGGLRVALPLLGYGPVMTLNSDVLWSGANPLALLQEAWNPEIMDGLLMCVPPAQTIGRAGLGDFSADDDGRITRGGGLVYGGAQIIKPRGLNAIPGKAFSLNLLWDAMIDTKTLYALTYPEYWCDVGHPEGIALAKRMLEDGDVRQE